VNRLLLLAIPALFAATAKAQSFDVSENALKAHVGFLASDTLQGRNTPSKELDACAEYIAAQFRRAGLEPAFGDSFFQMGDITNRRTGEVGQARNVGAILRGSDPTLATTYIVVSAHYDHLGAREPVEGTDTIFNGANDDASGVAGMIELSQILGAHKPKRSIMFVAWYGEEKGLVGSRWFVQHPPVNLKQIVANVNLEQIGRTDDSEGPRVAEANFTGFDFTDLPGIFQAANEGQDYKFTMHPQSSDSYFMRSDNMAFAAAGIPAHTISVAYEYPDYHGVGDHWDKLDYTNLAKTTRAVARGLSSLADRAEVPKWDRSLEKTKRFTEAYDKLMNGG
jgi:Zn-dependent M28 family amino/carboxypeptidase